MCWKPTRKKNIRNFVERHKDSIAFRRCSKEEKARWRACNAAVLTTHFSSITKLIEDNAIDTTRSSRPQHCTPEFRNLDHVTMMPTIFASGCMAPPLTVVKGKTLKFRVISRSGAEVTPTLADCLRPESIITVREDVAGVDSNIYFEWCKHFVWFCYTRTLLLHDRYRSNMTLRAVKFCLRTTSLFLLCLPIPVV